MTPGLGGRLRAAIGARAWRGVAVATSSLASAACAPAAAPSPCTTPGAGTTNWRAVDAGPFQLSLPPQYEREEIQGIDSVVRRWVASGRRSVQADFGMYSNSLNDAAKRMDGGRECMTRIGGRRVKVVTGYATGDSWGLDGPKYVVAAAWREPDGSSLLTLFATTPDSSGVPALLSIVRSIRIADR